MSTCQGAPAPHENCRHGDLCDWTESETPTDAKPLLEWLETELTGIADEPRFVVENRRERRARRRRALRKGSL